MKALVYMRVLSFYHVKKGGPIRNIIYFQKNTVGIVDEGLKQGQQDFPAVAAATTTTINTITFPLKLKEVI